MHKILWIMFIIHMCHHSSVAATLVKYDRDAQWVTWGRHTSVGVPILKTVSRPSYFVMEIIMLGKDCPDIDTGPCCFDAAEELRM